MERLNHLHDCVNDILVTGQDSHDHLPILFTISIIYQSILKVMEIKKMIALVLLLLKGKSIVSATIIVNSNYF